MLEKTDLAEQKQLESAIRAYYTRYYRDQLGLPNWQQKVESRLDEENVYAERMLDWIEIWANYPFAGKRALIVGAGTGVETFALQSRGANVTAIEPNRDAIGILAAKARSKFNVTNPAVQAIGEALPYPDNHFEFVYCYTVLEHVQSVEQTLDEMIRVCQPYGYIFLETPNYLYPLEQHYNIDWPPLMPRALGVLYLHLRGRPTGFIRTVNYITARRMTNLLRSKRVFTLRVFPPFPRWVFHPQTPRERLHRLLVLKLGITKNLFFILRKMPLIGLLLPLVTLSIYGIL
jgi:2-polyprenyl-3-methyl-5-hydroxy-6-metoxy-1,4-benzoquinol methylase